MALELDGDRARFEAKYAPTRRALERTLRWLPWTRAADRVAAGLADLVALVRPDAAVEAPVFVTGAYRSGTTLLERLLAGHPAFACFDHFSIAFPRSPELAALAARLSGRGPGAPAPDQPRVVLTSDAPAEGEALWRLSRGSPWRPDGPHVLGADFRDPAFERRLRRTIARQLRRRGGARFLNKNPLHTLRLGFLARVFPDARFVHVVRHPHRVLRSQLDLERMWARVLDGAPRDWRAAFSDTFMPPGRLHPCTPSWAAIAAARQHDAALAAALALVDLEQVFRDQAAAQGVAPRVQRLRYEDLLADPRGSLGAILLHLDLAGHSAAEGLLRRAEREVDTRLRSNRAPLPRFGAQVERALAPLVRELGYEELA
jgi:hypothetical protein